MERISEIAGAATRVLDVAPTATAALLGAAVLDKGLINVSPNLAAAGVVIGQTLAGVCSQATATDETPGVVTVRELLEELGAAARRMQGVPK